MAHEDATKPLSTANREKNRADVELCVQVMMPSGTLTLRLPPKSSVVLGRGTECDLTIDDESISRAHARITRTTEVTIEDLGSTNGTKVGGHRLEPNTREPIQVGAIVELGEIVLLLRPLSPEDAMRSSAPKLAPRRPAGSVTGAVFVHDSMKELYGLLEIIGPSDVNVLVLGETGVGKDVFAAAVHATSSRSDRPLVRINCAALAESLLEAELFGFEKGAFTLSLIHI